MNPALASSSIHGPARRRAMRLVMVGWVFGSVWITIISGAPLTVFALGLGVSNFEFGVLSSLPFLATLVSIPAVLLIDRTGKRKIIFLIGLYAQRLLWVPIALVPLWMIWHGWRAGSAAALVFLALLFLMYAVGNFGDLAWISWMADVVPERCRGKYFSRARQLGILTAIPAALLFGWLMDHYGAAGNQPTSKIMTICAMIFLLATFFGVAEVHFYHYVPDVPKPPRTVAVLGAFTRPFGNRQFLWFVAFVGTLVFAVSFMGQFLTLDLIQQVHASNISVQMMMLAAPMLGQLATLGVWGLAADRMGKKPVIALAALGLVPVGLGWCALTPANSWWLGYLLSTTGTILWCGVEVTNLNLVLEMSVKPNGETDSGFIAVNNILINIAGLLGALVAGGIAKELKSMHWQPFAGLKAFTFFDVLFLLSAVLRLAAVVIFLPHIKEPLARGKREALRFMTANIYNNLFNAISQPLRMVGLGKPERMGNKSAPP